MVGPYMAEGAFGKIFKGTYNDKEVAIKELHGAEFLSPELLKGGWWLRFRVYG